VRGGLLLDTSFVIDCWRNLGEAIARLERLFADGRPLYITEVIVCELFAGLHQADLEAARRFLEPIEFIQPGPATAVTAGTWRAEARARGATLHLPDALIAAAANAVGASVLTRNLRDFALTPVRVETY
jgi:predicted nucleic acid-binding protein